MMIEDGDFFRAAGLSAVVALIALVIAAITLGLFFGGAGQWWGPVNDVFTAILMFALIVPILATDRMVVPEAGLWFRVVTVAAVAGAVLAGVGQLLLVLGVIDLQTSFITGGLGFLPVLVWIGALVVVAGPMGLLPTSIAWFAAATIALIVVAAVITSISTGPLAWIAWIGVVIALALWMASLATTFLTRITT
jgi:hypothetical protein